MRTASICVFAHNEEREIEECLDCLVSETDGVDAEVHVVVNGSTDQTFEVASAYAQDKPNFHIHNLEAGDKANAWNHFIYEVGGDAEIYVFHDGDCQMRPGALMALHAGLHSWDEANAASGFPVTGGSKASWRRDLEETHGLSGNLYALSDRFVRRARALDFRLPFGLFGEDGFVGSIAQWDLDPTTKGVKERVVPCPDAEFSFNALPRFAPWAWKLYYKRLIRYSTRRYQIVMMKEPLKTQGLASLKPHMRDIYRERLHVCRLRWRGYWTLTDWVSLRRMRRAADSG